MTTKSDQPLASWVPDLTSREVSSKRILDIAQTPMTHLQRNELVTIAYQDLSDAMAGVIGSRNASWCTFSQWPSSTVRMLLSAPVPLVHEGVERAFGQGNRGVFNDIGQAYVAFLETVGATMPTSLSQLAAAMDECLLRLHAMVPAPGKPVWDIELEGLDAPGSESPEAGVEQRLLVQGLSLYGLSMLEDDPSAKAQMIYAGNLYLAAHEQWWLEEALSAGFRVPIRRLLHPALNRKSQREFRETDIHLGPLLGAEETIIHWLTRYAVGFWFNGNWVRVGVDLPDDGPADLDPINDPEAAHDLVKEVVHRWPQRASSRCWLSFDQRMGFIARLFRIHQQAPIGHPLSSQQASAILMRATALVMDEPKLPLPPKTLLPLRKLSALRHQIDVVAHDAVDPRAVGCKPTQTLKEVATAFRTAASPAPDGGKPDPFPAITADCERRWTELVDEGLIDTTTVEAAQAFYESTSIVVNASLLFSSLPDSYAAAKGVHVLGLASSLGSDPVRRTGETTNFLIDVMSTDLAQPTSRGRRAIVGVRGFHAITRWVIEGRGDWDAEVLGRPINQEDLFATMLTFVVPVFESLDRLGVPSTRAERDAYTQLWCAIGYLLGVEKSVLVRGTGGGKRLLTHDEATLISAQIRHQQRARSRDGVNLLAALIEDVSDNFPRPLRHLPQVLLRFVGDPDVAAVLMTPQRESMALNVLLDIIVGAAGLPIVKTRIPIAVRSVSEKWLAMFVKQGFGNPYMDPKAKQPDPALRNHIPKGCLDERLALAR